MATAASAQVVVSEDKTIMQAFGVKASFLDLLPRERESTETITLSPEDTELYFKELSRRVLSEAICNAAVALVRLECLGCRCEANGIDYAEDQHGLCKRSCGLNFLLEDNPAFFMGFLFARNNDGFLIDSKYFEVILPYVNPNTLLAGGFVHIWPPTAILMMYLRQKHVYKPFFTNNPSLSGLDIGRLEECDVNAFMIRVLGGKCETSTRGILVEIDGAKKLQVARIAVAV